MAKEELKKIDVSLINDKLTPKWYKERTGYNNLTSIYDIPVKESKGRIIEFNELMELLIKSC